MMNILLFEKDASFAALLSSELSAAGYSCTSARTAVELFHRMSLLRFELALINIAQAAAGRKEFWVALHDRKGGSLLHTVTYRCHNLAGYTLDDTDAHEYHPDPDIDMRNIDMLYLVVQKVQQVLPQSGGVRYAYPQSTVSSYVENEYVTHKLQSFPRGRAKELPVTSPFSSVLPPSSDEWRGAYAGSNPSQPSRLQAELAMSYEDMLQRNVTPPYTAHFPVSVHDRSSISVGDVLQSKFDKDISDTSVYQATPSSVHRDSGVQPLFPLKPESFPTQGYSLESVLLTQGMISPLHMETASALQHTLQQASMRYRLIDILLLFKFIDFQRLLLALLLARGVLSAQQLRACIRMREELAAVGQEYTLEQLLVVLRFATTQDIEAATAYLSENHSL